MQTSKFTWAITGGAGFIGSHLAKELVKKGQTVVIFDNFSSGNKENLAAIKDKVRIIEGDIRNLAALKQAFAGVDYVLHHAALISVPESVEKPLETVEINITGTANVLEAARANQVKRVVFASSSAVYGNGLQMPYAENSPLEMQSPYALSKQVGAELCQLYTRIYGLETVALRYFNVFGPGQNPRSAYAAVIAKFMDLAAQGQPLTINWDGQQSRDFIHVEDVVQANLLAALKGQAGQIYNVARGETYSLLQLADLIEKIVGHKIERVFSPKRAGDVKCSSANTQKIRALGFCPMVPLEEGLREMWAQKQREK